MSRLLVSSKYPVDSDFIFKSNSYACLVLEFLNCCSRSFLLRVPFASLIFQKSIYYKGKWTWYLHKVPALRLGAPLRRSA